MKNIGVTPEKKLLKLIFVRKTKNQRYISLNCQVLAKNPMRYRNNIRNLNQNLFQNKYSQKKKKKKLHLK